MKKLRGLHLVLVNRESGVVWFARVFDTYNSSDELDKLISQEFPKNTIVIAAC